MLTSKGYLTVSYIPRKNKRTHVSNCKSEKSLNEKLFVYLQEEFFVLFYFWFWGGCSMGVKSYVLTLSISFQMKENGFTLRMVRSI